uniref:Isoleucyl-tRNA synthetase 1 n=1 Tax=Xiphophorus couchianus TaxID=32473 RepID=A0A3B5M3P3_9TELE
MYTFDQTSGSAAQYEAHSDAQVLVLLDVTPDQSMVDEGVAREVINRIQKLRKKAHLVPSDEISVYYRCQPEGEYLGSVIEAHTDFILATTKAPLLPFPVPKTASVIIEEKTQLKGSDLAFTIVKGSSLSQTPPNGPACAYVNLRVKVNNTEQGMPGWRCWHPLAGEPSWSE